MTYKSILLVDDERDIHEPVAIALRAAGYAVDVAETVAAAWAQLRTHDYSAVIADWRLADGDGVALLDWAADQGARTLLMSGYLFLMPGGRAERHQTLMKPLRPSEIVAAVERSVGKAEIG